MSTPILQACAALVAHTAPFLALMKNASSSRESRNSSALSLLPLPLLLPSVNNDYAAVLAKEGCSKAAISVLLDIYQTGVEELRRAMQDRYDTTFRQLAFKIGDELAHRSYARALSASFGRQFEDSAEEFRSAILEQVRIAKAKVLSSPRGRNSPARLASFTPTTVALLESIFTQRSNVTPADKQELSTVTGLSPKQIGVWVSPPLPRRGGC